MPVCTECGHEPSRCGCGYKPQPCPSCAAKDDEIERLNAVINGLITGQANAAQRAETAEAALAVAEKKLALLRDGKVRPLASNDFRRPVVYCRPLDLASGVWPTLYDTLDDALEAVMKKIND